MHILNTQTLVCQNSETIYSTFVAYSNYMTSEMTQYTVFSRLCPKSHIFCLLLHSEAQCDIFYVIYLKHVQILKSVIFQEVLHILYFKLIPTISQKFDSTFLGQKLEHTLYSPFSNLCCIYIAIIPVNLLFLQITNVFRKKLIRYDLLK